MSSFHRNLFEFHNWARKMPWPHAPWSLIFLGELRKQCGHLRLSCRPTKPRPRPASHSEHGSATQAQGLLSARDEYTNVRPRFLLCPAEQRALCKSSAGLSS